MLSTWEEVPTTDLELDVLSDRGKRSPGLHVTDIIHFLEVELGHEKPNRDYAGWEHAGSTGFFLEDAIAGGMAMQRVTGVKRFQRGFEIQRDGIFLTPDGYDLDALEDWECKCTWKSLNSNPPEQIWKWVVQFKAYCWVMGCQTTQLLALYICGDFTRPIRPRLIMARMVFTQEELALNWRMLLNGKQAMIERGLI